ncbi:sugar ABC transporter permease [Reticulibacter mediterranei]|uniref:Sugar ABC transporter permease n=1 Tax=Reticulibacter mediterranei TaxID=2778369 RepID=A0A8J3NB34_9CHLR|nr:carbohydrate ABC transporter permease [Reticulibacter mediterranei]GHP01058.1 sugar ABC transporter permease [Reticulibacter mediterranei]
MAVQQLATPATRLAERPRRRQRSVTRIITLVVLAILAIIWILPILWAIDTSLKPEGETTAVPVSWFASHFTLDAYITTFATTNLPRWYFNSFLTSAIISIVTVILASMAAFAFSRVPFKGRSILFWIILAGIMVPVQILIVPLFTQMQSLGLVDTYWGIMLPQFASPIAVFIFKQYFDGIPRELEEAAIMDGASRWRVYWQIWMPLARPAIAAVAIFAFVISWNNFLWPFIVITGNNMMTVPVGLSTVQTSFGIRYAQIMASAVLGGIPVLIVFLFFQRQIVQGIAGTGLKG